MKPRSARSAPKDLSDRVLEKYIRFVQPSNSGLPNWRVLLVFPVLAALAVTIFIALHWSGSSSGVHFLTLGSGEDPRLISGVPRPIRSDEWLVQQSWVVSQANNNYGEINHMFPGGTDATVLSELPTWNWSSLFRPHLWGYLFFGLDAGVAWHWWVPALALVIGCYVFVVSMLPKRPLTAALFAVGAYFTPLLQWFYTPSSVWPVAWALLAMAATVWIYRDSRHWVRVIWSSVVGYVAVTMAMGLYVPFILPGVYAFAAFAIGYALRIRPWSGVPAIATVKRVAPFVVAGLTAGAVTIIWVISRASTFDAIQSTVYPGHRSLPTGALLKTDPFLTGFAGAPWGRALQTQGSSILGGNASEGSSAILLAVFVLPGILWFIVRSLRKGKQVDWLLIAMVAYLVAIFAYLFVPGWDAVAHILQFDRIAPERFRIGFVVLLPVFGVLVIDRVDTLKSRATWLAGVLSALVTLVLLAVLYIRIKTTNPEILGMARHWKIVVALLVIAVFCLFVRRLAFVAAGSLLIVALLISWGVNPVYRGIYNLSTTTIGAEVRSVDKSDEGTWVGIGTAEAMAVLMQTGVESLSGVQNYPSKAMWSEIDPTSRYESSWNRLAHVHWIVESGPPKVTSPWGDVVQVTFDPCSAFGQKYVEHVLTDQAPIESSCLREVSETRQGTLEMRIYDVVPRG